MRDKTKKNKKTDPIKVPDLKPVKDAKGGFPPGPSRTGPTGGMGTPGLK